MADTEKPSTNPIDSEAPRGASFKCPHCGHAQIVQIRASEVVAIGKCPNCGELVAPAKQH